MAGLTCICQDPRSTRPDESMTSTKQKILSLSGITKTYPGVTALSGVSVEFHSGEVHAIIGENGAGKSTMIKIISGAEVPDSGTIEYESVVYEHMTPHLSRQNGIDVVYQEINLVPTLSASENIFLGNPIVRGLTLDRKEMSRRATELFERIKLGIDPKARIKDLTIPQMQLVEVAKAVSKIPKVLILDEPTAMLTDTEIEILFDLIRDLRNQGTCIIYISHRLQELSQIADTVTVMRDGQKIVHLKTSETSRKELISYMVGRDVAETFPERNIAPGETKLEVRKLSGNGIRNISFAVRAGEIVGLAGLVGAGRTELVRLIFGADPKSSGEILVDGRPVEIKHPRDAVEAGIGFIPEDRKGQGVLLNMSTRWNIVLPMLRQLSGRLMIVDRNRVDEICNDFKDRLDIRTPNMDQLARNLSGGNQQKLVLSKWVARKPHILILDEPTRGIDVGAKQEIYRLISKLAEEGYAVVMISSELPEVIGLSDRILVVADGQIAGELERPEFDQDKILNYAFVH